MSVLSWFSKKSTSKSANDASHGGMSSGRAPGSVQSVQRKAERYERREQLYAVVRDAMTRAGVLSASYKFKVLSLDSRGANYLVMMDLSSQAGNEVARLAEIEALIAQNAKTRHEILVSAVYWRSNEHVTAGLSEKRASPLAAPSQVHPVEVKSPAQNEVDVNEVLTFKNAFASAAVAAPLAASGEILKSGRRNPQPQPHFENTEVLDSDERASPLGTTQYGDLN